MRKTVSKEDVGEVKEGEYRCSCCQYPRSDKNKFFVQYCEDKEEGNYAICKNCYTLYKSSGAKYLTDFKEKVYLEV